MITLNLSVDEANYVLQALSLRPFAEVNGLIANIKAQAEACLVKEPTDE